MPWITASADNVDGPTRANDLDIDITAPSHYNSFFDNVITDREIWINGTASPVADITKVEIRFNSGSWQLCNGKESWSRKAALPQGEVTIEARVMDTSDNSALDEVNVKVDSHPPMRIMNLTAEVGHFSGEVRLKWAPWPLYDYDEGIELPGAERNSIMIYIRAGSVAPISVSDMEVYERWAGLENWETGSKRLPKIYERDVSKLKNGERYWFAVVALDDYGNYDENLEEGVNLVSAKPVAPPETANICLTVFLPVFLLLLTAGVLFLAAPGKTLKRFKKRTIDVLRPYIYVSPAVGALMLLTFYPVFYGFYISFTNMDKSHIFDYSIIGFDNYVKIFSDPIKVDQFWDVTGRTFMWTISNVVITMALGLGIALVLNRKMKGKLIYRTLLLLPWAMPAYICCLIWKGMFNYKFGAINHMLTFAGIDPVPWLDKMPYAFWACVITNVWLGVPFMVMVFSGGLQSISGDLYEAARVDGVSGWKQFRHITLPLLKPTIIPASLLSFIWTFNMFNVIYLVTGGGPGGKTDILITYVYDAAFSGNNEYAFAAAYSVVIFFMLLSFSVVYMKISSSQGDDQ